MPRTHAIAGALAALLLALPAPRAGAVAPPLRVGLSGDSIVEGGRSDRGSAPAAARRVIEFTPPASRTA